jgi:hypothetical protein
MIPRTTHAAVLVGLLAACNGVTPQPVDPTNDTGGSTQVIAEDPEGISDGDEAWGIVETDPSYARVVDRVAGMTQDDELQQQVNRRGLSLVNVMWEDTGRDIGSSVGPNISDVTLQVRYRQPGAQGESSALMPVIRFPNFSDRTGDIASDKFLLRMGNHRRDKTSLKSVQLTDVLRDIRRFASRPDSILGSGNLLADRDTHFLVSAQAVFLPIPQTGKAEFNPVVFNYQSSPGAPAVLTILVTRQGTSMTVVENRPEDGTVAGWGQELYFNNHGKRAAFTAERLSAVKQRIDAQGGPKTQDDRSALDKGADVMFLIQVPLKHRAPMRMQAEEQASDAAPAPAAPMAPGATRAREGSNVERAVLGHGRNRGPFQEGRGLRLERDARFPVRITVQFYKATSNGVASERDLDAIASSIGSVYEHADFVGSLVVPQGDPQRPTAWTNIPNAWFPW